MRKLVRIAATAAIVIVTFIFFSAETITIQQFGWLMLDTAGGGFIIGLAGYLPE